MDNDKWVGDVSEWRRWVLFLLNYSYLFNLFLILLLWIKPLNSHMIWKRTCYNSPWFYLFSYSTLNIPLKTQNCLWIWLTKRLSFHSHNSCNINIGEHFDIPGLPKSFYYDKWYEGWSESYHTQTMCVSKDQFEWLEIYVTDEYILSSHWAITDRSVGYNQVDNGQSVWAWTWLQVFVQIQMHIYWQTKLWAYLAYKR